MTTLPPAPPLPPARPDGRHLPALDGLRALAVIGVIAFHAFPALAPGGFSGVDVFFVLSGFLITGGLLHPRTTGRPLAGFWVARARRLAPALVLLILVVGPLVLVVGGDAGIGFGAQAASAGLFMTNWHLIATGSSYFAESSPPVLQHLWSLAVEEQFYLMWPVALLAIHRLTTSLRQRLTVVVALALASLAAMVAYAATGHLGRGYYGSDSHSFGLLAGAALAMLYAARPPRPVPAARSASAAALAVAGLVLAFRGLDGNAASTYLWGLPAVVGLTLLLVHLSATDAGLLERTLGGRPLQLIGQRSYGLYLWHWPLLVLVHNLLPTASLEHPVTTGLVAISVTAVAAWASYRWIEVPIRQQGLRRWASGLVGWARGPQPYRLKIASALAALPALAVVLTVVAATNGPRAGVEQRQIEAGLAAIRHADYQAANTTPAITPSPHVRRPVTGRDVTAVGDSVMLAAAPSLLQRLPGIAIDAVVSRQATAAPGVLRQLARRGLLRPVVVLGLGTNGNIATSTLDAIRAAVGGRELMLVNVFVPREWQTPVNDELRWYAAHHPHTTLVDWHDAIAAQVGLLAPDHIHPGPTGGDLYVQTLASALGPLRIG